jgi:hypothetical protein
VHNAGVVLPLRGRRSLCSLLQSCPPRRVATCLRIPSPRTSPRTSRT